MKIELFESKNLGFGIILIWLWGESLKKIISHLCVNNNKKLKESLKFDLERFILLEYSEKHFDEKTKLLDDLQRNVNIFYPSFFLFFFKAFL